MPTDVSHPVLASSSVWGLLYLFLVGLVSKLILDLQHLANLMDRLVS